MSTQEKKGFAMPAAVGALWAEHASGRRDHSRNLWGLLVLGLWYDRHIERHGA